MRKKSILYRAKLDGARRPEGHVLRYARMGIVIGTVLSMLLVVMTGCGKSTTGLTKVRLQEVAHSIFYAPMYVALEEGYFEEEGLNVELTNGNGADKVMTAMIAGEADIGFMGPEATIYVYNEGNSESRKLSCWPVK